MFISFLGCDGSGKSAVLDGLCKRMREHGMEIYRGHWRPVPFSQANENPGTADDPHGKSPRGFVTSVLKLAWLWGCWWLAWFKHLRGIRSRGHVIFDRYYMDLWVDPRRYRYGAPLFFAKLVFRFMPQPDMVFFLDAEPEVLLSRKQEVGKESLEAAREKYLALCKTHPRFVIIDASRSLDQVIDEIYKKIQVNHS